MTPTAALAFVRTHGIVLASARGRVPNVAAEVAGEPIRGSWWGHARGQQIFRVLEYLYSSADVLVCRLVDGKVTLVHRRLWPALVRVADRFPANRVSEVQQSHSATGNHVSREQPFPGWVPAEVLARSRTLSEADAIAALGLAVTPGDGPASPPKPRGSGARPAARRSSGR